MPDLSELTEAVKKGNRNEAVRVTQEAIAAQVDPAAILDALVTGMDDVGRRFKANEIFVPEVLIAARAMKLSMELLEPLLVEAAREKGAQVIGLSALLTTTMPAVAQAVEALRAAGLTSVKIMVGGAPVTEEFADEIKADGYAPDAASAVDLARRLAVA